MKTLTWLAAIVAVTFELGNPSASVRAATFANGADVGWLTQFESTGVKWRNSAGVQQDPLQSLAEQGINAIRLRVFVNPPADGLVGGFPIGFCDKASVVAVALRAKKAGLTRLLIDFHYSDSFADPGKQNKPAAWASHSIDQLVTDVHDHTLDVMSALAAVGIYPQWVQVGNEINSGILWPEGRTTNFGQLTRLLNAGYDAVKAVSSSTKVVIHLANGYDNATFRSWFDSFTNTGGKCDVIGMSYYPYWANVDYTQDIAALSANLKDMASRYGKEVMIAEVGGQETNPANTHDLLVATIAAVKAVPDGKGVGVFYWEPESHSSITGGYVLGATTRLAANDLQFSSAISAFATPKPSQIAVGPTVGTNQFVNLSTRGVAEPGENALISGFVISGSGGKQLLIRGIANSLLPFGLTGVLRKPLLTLYDANRQIIKTATILNSYQNSQGGALTAPVYLSPPDAVQIRSDLLQTSKQAGAFDFTLPVWATQSQLTNASIYAQGDTAMIVNLTPGLYSVAIAPDATTATYTSEPAPAPYNASGNSGLVLLEIYDLSPTSGSRFVNLSSRGKIETGARQMIVGFVISGDGSRRVLIRGIGPSLINFGVNGALDDSSIELFDSSSKSLLANDNWPISAWVAQTAMVSPTVGAFDLAPTSLDGVILAQLPASGYSAVVSSVLGDPGVGLAEIYECP